MALKNVPECTDFVDWLKKWRISCAYHLYSNPGFIVDYRRYINKGQRTHPIFCAETRDFIKFSNLISAVIKHAKLIVFIDLDAEF